VKGVGSTIRHTLRGGDDRRSGASLVSVKVLEEAVKDANGVTGVCLFLGWGKSDVDF